MSDGNTVRDDRIGLKSNQLLTVKEEHTGNACTVKITGELGRGSACIVYSGKLKKYVEGYPIESDVVVKELFPKGIGAKRNDENDTELLIPEEKSVSFEMFRNSFGKRFISFSEYAKTPGCRALPDAYIYGEANNTVYAIICSIKGRLLSKAHEDNTSLEKIASVMEAVCRSISGLHIKEKLYLDLKPENILYDISSNELQAKVYLIDFDTVQKLDNIRSGTDSSCPYSPRWSAPEQMIKSRDGMYKDPGMIGYHTDIYSVGAVFFYLLTGKAPDKNDVNAISLGSFAWHDESPCLKSAVHETREFVNELLTKMLESDPKIRQRAYPDFLSITEVEKDFTRLYGMTAGNNIHFEPIHMRISSLENEVVQLKQEIRNMIGAIKN